MNLLRKKIFEPKGASYKIEDLGDAEFQIGDEHFKWVDLEFTSIRQAKLVASYYVSKDRPVDTLIVMCTGNMGNRVSAQKYMKFILQRGFSLAHFDYNGLGHSQKLPLSYGLYEKEDLNLFLEVLSKELSFKKLVLWGRSMGTAVVLQFYHKYVIQQNSYPSLKALLLTSMFFSLEEVLFDKFKGNLLARFFPFWLMNKLKANIKENYNFEMEFM